MIDKIEWWCLQSTNLHKTRKEKQFYQNKLNKITKLVEELNE